MTTRLILGDVREKLAELPDVILIELNPEYAALADARITDDGPLFAEVTA